MKHNVTLLVVVIAVIFLAIPLFAQERILSDIAYAHHPNLLSPGDISDLSLDLSLPPEVPKIGYSELAKSPWPVVVLCHGGSYVSGDKADMSGLARALARRSIACISINYRLGQVPDAESETQAISMVYDDVRAAFDWLASNAQKYGLDSNRVYIGGGSSGGHMTIATAVLYPLESKKSVNLRGAIDMFGGYFSENLHAKAIPMLILQGTDDRSCLPDASRKMATMYRNAGAWCRLCMVEGMVHDWDGPLYTDKIITRMDEFIRQTSTSDFTQRQIQNESEIFMPRESQETIVLTGGTFTMGSDNGPNEEKPAHKVSIAPFRMARTETSVAQFAAFVQETGYITTTEQNHNAYIVDLLIHARTNVFEFRYDASWKKPYYPQDEGFPAALISHTDAQRYCNWLSVRDGYKPVYRFDANQTICDWKANGWRLPTEAEWEFAARKGFSGKVLQQEKLAIHSDYALPAPCLRVAADASGFYQLLGNVTEWCEDWYDLYSSTPQQNPHGPADGAVKVLRGGSWYQDLWYTELLHPSRRWWAPGDDPVVSCDVGFRVVRLDTTLAGR